VGTVASGPWGAGGAFAWTDRAEWMNGGFFLVGYVGFTMPPDMGGAGKEIWGLGYDAARKVYTRDGFTSDGRHDVSQGKLDHGAWIWTSTGNYGGQQVHQRMTMKVLSPGSYSMKFEVSEDSRNWSLFMEGKATKE